MRRTTTAHGEHHGTVPDHARLRVGTLGGIIADVAAHVDLPREEVVKRLFGSL